MTSTRTTSWQEIQNLIRQRIQDRIWSPGELIPGEVQLAEQFGCARTTVNRALRELAATGVIDRKRKAGTRVAQQQTRRVTAQIPVIRAQVEARNQIYHFDVLENRQVNPPARIRKAMALRSNARIMHIRSVHFANDVPYIYEDRWVNTSTVAPLLQIDLELTSVNEWLVTHVPFTEGEFVVDATAAGKTVAKVLQMSVGEPVLRSRRSTWLEQQSVTVVHLYYGAQHELRFEI